jgi:hypothetical protein
MNDIALRLAKKTKEKFIFEALESCDTCIINFDLWMSKGGVDTFVLTIHFLNHNWEPGHKIIGLFETTNTFGAIMAIQMNEVLATYGLNVKIFAYVKIEGNNLITMTTALTFVVSCEVLIMLTTPFTWSCWGHAMSKCCQYAIDDINVCVRLKSISIKKCQFILQMTITSKVVRDVKKGRNHVCTRAYVHGS